ncbi:unnamed protein product [Microthlaspi erraticum]|uniref:X8 domain-containing protein n=1 Tax=Microthlaspi erraticum TaxID=1685480 RepID=A0A6D2I6N6_9BRAS|nr:unnamed protein product [Microthlaspi erraticum]
MKTFLISATIALLFISSTLPQNSADRQFPDDVVQAALDWACQNGVDCGRIQLGQNCYSPDTLMDHASVIFNDYFQRNKHSGATCDFHSAAVFSETDPSHDSCSFPYIP